MKEQLSQNNDNKIQDKQDEKMKINKRTIIVTIIMTIITTMILAPVMLIIFIICVNIGGTIDKPVIYLYPTEEQEIEVALGREDILTCTYPKYENSWKVIAKPNGDLTDIKTGRRLYCLYWEGKSNVKSIEEGFCVKNEDTTKFLEEKLAILGLTEREANEFIIYWLPKLEDNEYNLISFETMEEINENMPLKITPKPDTLIRVMMKFKGVDNYTKIKEQELVTPKREGYIVVEWGGAEIK